MTPRGLTYFWVSTTLNLYQNKPKMGQNDAESGLNSLLFKLLNILTSFRVSLTQKWFRPPWDPESGSNLTGEVFFF